jgi:hypothetical protein
MQTRTNNKELSATLPFKGLYISGLALIGIASSWGVTHLSKLAGDFSGNPDTVRKSLDNIFSAYGKLSPSSLAVTVNKSPAKTSNTSTSPAEKKSVDITPDVNSFKSDKPSQDNSIEVTSSKEVKAIAKNVTAPAPASFVMLDQKTLVYADNFPNALRQASIDVAKKADALIGQRNERLNKQSSTQMMAVSFVIASISPDGTTTPLFARHPDLKCSAASTAKLPIGHAVLSLIDQGKIERTNSISSDLESMLIKSNNDATHRLTNLALKALGGKADDKESIQLLETYVRNGFSEQAPAAGSLQERYAKAYKDFVMNNFVGDGSQKFYSNFWTHDGALDYFATLYANKSQGVAHQMLNILRRDEQNNKLFTHNRSFRHAEVKPADKYDITLWSKTGSSLANISDMAMYRVQDVDGKVSIYYVGFSINPLKKDPNGGFQKDSEGNPIPAKQPDANLGTFQARVNDYYSDLSRNLLRLAYKRDGVQIKQPAQTPPVIKKSTGNTSVQHKPTERTQKLGPPNRKISTKKLTLKADPTRSDIRGTKTNKGKTPGVPINRNRRARTSRG